MSEEIRLEGLGIAPGVLETIVTIAAETVTGVASVGAPGLAGIVQKGARKGAARTVDVTVDDESRVSVSIHLRVEYGQRLRQVAHAVQGAVSDALVSQVGVEVAGVDVFIDGLVFAE
jgi:uncharacterized alkaline shock family protein YloU